MFYELIYPRPLYYWPIGLFLFGVFTILFTYCSTKAVDFGQYLLFSLGYPVDKTESKE